MYSGLLSRCRLLECGPSLQDLSPSAPSGAAGSMRGSHLEPEQGLFIPLDSRGVCLFIFPSPTLMSVPYCLLSHTSFGHPALPQGKRSICPFVQFYTLTQHLEDRRSKLWGLPLASALPLPHPDNQQQQQLPGTPHQALSLVTSETLTAPPSIPGN